MKVTAKVEYACLALMELAKLGTDESPKRIRDIAEARGIPERYLMHIFLQLKTAGMVQSVRGADGGYKLVRSPEFISVADIIDAINGPDEPPRKSTLSFGPELIELFNRAHQAERHVLASTNIAQLSVDVFVGDWMI